MHGGKEKREKNRTLETEGCGTRRIAGAGVVDFKGASR
jgi:hypothetical protein